MEMILVLHNIRSTYNVGAILRTAEGFGVSQVVLSGWTPATKWARGAVALPHVLEKTTVQIAKTALGAERLVPSEWSKDIGATLESLHKAGYIVVGLENNLKDGKIFNLADWKEAIDKIQKDGSTKQVLKNTKGTNIANWPKNTKLVLVLGEEVNGIDCSLFDKIDFFLEIPMVGKKESFNVSVAAGIAMYELLAR